MVNKEVLDTIICAASAYTLVSSIAYMGCVRNSIMHNNFAKDFKDHLMIGFETFQNFYWNEPKFHLIPSAYAAICVGGLVNKLVS